MFAVHMGEAEAEAGRSTKAQYVTTNCYEKTVF